MKALKANISAYHNEVTGSRFLVVVERPDDTVYRIVIDWGYFQEPKYRYLNYVDDLNPENIDAIVVTHNLKYRHSRIRYAERIAHIITISSRVGAVAIRYDIAEGDAVAGDALSLECLAVGVNFRYSLIYQAIVRCRF